MYHRLFASCVSVVAVATLCAAPVFAQVNIQPGVIDKQVPSAKVPFLRDKRPETAPLTTAPAQEQVSNANEVVATVNRVTFNGFTVGDDAELQVIAAPFLNKPMTRGQLADLKYQVGQYFYKRGYILVRVVTPPQDVKDGELQVDIHEGTVGEVKINGEVVKPFVVRGMAKRLNQGSVFNEKDAESFVSDLNDLQNVRGSISLQPGRQFKTTDINVTTEPSEDNRHYISVDNYGNDLTGPNVLQAHFEQGNLLNLGEKYTLDLRRGNKDLWDVDSNEELWSYNLGFETPTGFYDTLFSINLFQSENDIGDIFANQKVSGQTDSVTFALAHDILNTDKQKVTVRGGLDVRHHESFRASGNPAGHKITESEDNIRELFVEGSYLYRANETVAFGSLKAIQGIDALGASSRTRPPFDNRSRNGDPTASILQPLAAVYYRPSDVGLVKFVGSGQVASQAVLASDLFVLGGFGSVRGFQPAETSGDSGVQFSLEYNHTIDVHPEWVVAAGPFVDGGRVYNRIDGAAVDETLLSAGLGVEVSTDLIESGATTMRVDWAHTLGDYDSATVDDNMLLVRLLQNF